MRTRLSPVRAAVIGLALISSASFTHAFDSGSTDADGALAPTVDTEVVLPPSGILNYSSINIPANVRVTFRKNTTNTPVVLLVSGDATISGTIDVSGQASAYSGTAGDGVLADDGQPGAGGPGGYSGGRGGRPGAVEAVDRLGGKGLGPGGGGGGARQICDGVDYEAPNQNGRYVGLGAGGGGGFGTQGSRGASVENVGPRNCLGSRGGASYGAAELLPLIGGSGGGGGNGAITYWSGGGGGGGGGAILIAVSGTLTVTNTTGRILANGGVARATSSTSCNTGQYSAGGGGGSGGAIRLVATTLAGNGTISADSGAAESGSCGNNGGFGAGGRIRLEAEVIRRTGGTTIPAASQAQPSVVFIGGAPTLTIQSVAGVAVPQPPTGVADVQLPATTANPITVNFTTTGIPVGNTVRLSVVPANGQEVTAVSTALNGSTANASASASIALPAGASTLQASVTYTVIVAVGDSLSRFAQGERVERITVTAGLDGKSSTKLVTVSGREFDAPAEALRIAAFGG
ncbi:hypothetical protein [Methyloversatilis sp.]|uniref:hypothetical protein n=1 Tax=Methyloversatilis sp. TaxID=2569862 RepID=UPI00273710D3|nr:hypothetical protein [Methyloversatilis sp.]MDP3457039.1 hypothetical protein [Methyloversatilis sp.]